MRYIIYILSIFILFSCNTTKSIVKEKEDVVIDTTLKVQNINDTTILDSIKEDPIVLAIEREVRVVEPEKKIDNSGIELVKEEPKKKRTIKVVDKTSTIVESSNLGLVAHSVPEKMQVGKTYTVRLRISKENNKIQLINGNGVSIADANVDSRITIASIRVEPVMSAKLISDSSKMVIQSTSTLIQDIEEKGFTEWEWRLTPTKGGDIFLKIMVSVIVKSESGTITKDIPVYNEVLVVKSNYIFSIKLFIKEYWQWIMTTVIIPFIVWFYNRKKKRKKS